MKKIIIFFCLLNLNLKANHEIIRPFGTQPAKQKPREQARIINIRAEAGIKANQVCGYTDWSSSVITLPKHLLSGEYWGEQLDTLKKQATDTVLALSGALPAMLACNASPTFCEIMNNSKLLAQGELGFTMDTCKILDGVANNQNLQSEPLRQCIQKQLLRKDEKGPHGNSTLAREMCLRSEEECDRTDWKENHVYAPQEFFDIACSEDKLETRRFQNNYTIQKKSCSLMKEILPGVELKAQGKVVKEGSYVKFSAPVIYSENRTKAQAKMVGVLAEMKKERYQNFLPKKAVVKKANITRLMGYEANGEAPKDDDHGQLWELSRDPDTPSELIVDPEMLFEVVDALGPEMNYTEEAVDKSKLKYVLGSIASAVAFKKTNALFSDMYARTQQACTDPSLQGQTAQLDCKIKLERISAERSSLKDAFEAEEMYMRRQKLFYEQVDAMRNSQFEVKSSERSAHRPQRELLNPIDL